jgi:hypothetical protein
MKNLYHCYENSGFLVDNAEPFGPVFPECFLVTHLPGKIRKRFLGSR